MNPTKHTTRAAMGLAEAFLVATTEVWADTNHGACQEPDELDGTWVGAWVGPSVLVSALLVHPPARPFAP